MILSKRFGQVIDRPRRMLAVKQREKEGKLAPMSSSELRFLAGASAVDIHYIGANYWKRRGFHFEPAGCPQRMRCLMMSHGNQLVAILNADWFTWRLLDETKEIIQALAPDKDVELICGGTLACHNVDFPGVHWGIVDPKDPRFDAEHRQDILAAVEKVVHEATQRLEPATVAVGYGTCASIATNCYFGDGGDGRVDPRVSVVRFDTTAGEPIAVAVNFACWSDDTDQQLGGGLAGAMERVVQKQYGPFPVLFWQGGVLDHFPALREPDLDVRAQQGREEYRRQHGLCLVTEFGRLGRVLGGEVIKVMAELEVAGQPLLAQNERWRPTSWLRVGAGLRVEQPALRHATFAAHLGTKPLPSGRECDERIKATEGEIRSLAESLPFAPDDLTPYPLDPDDKESILYRLMTVGSQRAYLGQVAGGAKWQERYGRQRIKRSNVRLLALSPDIAIVYLPGAICRRTIAPPILSKSPFAYTLICEGTAAPGGLGHIIPEEEQALGGGHAGMYAFAQTDIDQLCDDIVDELRRLKEQYSYSYEGN
jgi:hypothetical protein